MGWIVEHRYDLNRIKPDPEQVVMLDWISACHGEQERWLVEDDAFYIYGYKYHKGTNLSPLFELFSNQPLPLRL